MDDLDLVLELDLGREGLGTGKMGFGVGGGLAGGAREGAICVLPTPRSCFWAAVSGNWGSRGQGLEREGTGIACV